MKVVECLSQHVNNVTTLALHFRHNSLCPDSQLNQSMPTDLSPTY